MLSRATVIMWWKRRRSAIGHLDGAREHHVGMRGRRCRCRGPRLRGGDVVRHFVRGPAVSAGSAGVAGLVGRVVRNFGLIEVGSAVVAVPQHLELLVVLDEETVGGDVVAVDHQAVVAEVAGPANAVAMIGAPDPGVVDDGVVAVDAQIRPWRGRRPLRRRGRRRRAAKMGFCAWTAWLPSGPTSMRTGEILFAGIDRAGRRCRCRRHRRW